jgi:hypothetical protein
MCKLWPVSDLQYLAGKKHVIVIMKDFVFSYKCKNNCSQKIKKFCKDENFHDKKLCLWKKKTTKSADINLSETVLLVQNCCLYEFFVCRNSSSKVCGFNVINFRERCQKRNTFAKTFGETLILTLFNNNFRFSRLFGKATNFSWRNFAKSGILSFDFREKNMTCIKIVFYIKTFESLKLEFFNEQAL